MTNLVIGNTSQLSQYFPDNFARISSRNIDFDLINSKKFDKIWLTFAEQRTFLDEVDFNYVNFNYTIDVINKLKDKCSNIFLFSTSELWNQYQGPINLQMEYKYDYTPYIKSKEILCNYIKENRESYKNVIIIYPFNFNSIHRKPGFLFYKIFNSIINKKFEELGNVNFNRDLIHPSTLIRESLNTKSDRIIGSGELFNVRKFIEDIYKSLGLEISQYLFFKETNYLNNKRLEYYNQEKNGTYEELLSLTVSELKKFI